MILKFGMDVITSESEKAGKLETVIIDPATDKITHLIVREGLLFTKDKIVPFNLVVDGDEDRIQLREFEGDIEDLQDYREQDFVHVENYINNQLGGKIVPLIYYSPLGISRAQEIELEGIKVTREKLNRETESLKEGLDVLSLDEENVGKVKEIILHPTEGKVTHVLISEGVLIKSKVLIPAAWIDSITGSEVKLFVDSSLVKNLPEFKQKI
jgi:sporulation protein YlmC with PRC-barrel domain